MTEAVAVTADLIFSTKILSTAGALGIEARSVATPDALAGMLRGGGTRLVMVDMALPNEEGVRAIERIRIHADGGEPPVIVAFYSHVQGALGEAARRAGATRVMPRSQFSDGLPELLRAHCKPSETSSPGGG